MAGTPEDLRDRIHSALENPNYRWRTPEGISAETGIELGDVIKNIDGVKGLIQHSIGHKDGRELYSTRNHWEQTAPLYIRILSLVSDKVF